MEDWARVGSGAVFAACSALLCLEMASIGFVTPLIRQKRNVWLNEEDALRFSGTVAEVEHRDVARMLRVHRNQLENCVPFFVLGRLWIATGGSAGLGTVLFAVFTLSRIAHPIFYLARLGRLRTAAFTFGFLSLLLLGGGVFWRLLTS
jgi:uncharacterized MAPEG superfamily protein